MSLLILLMLPVATALLVCLLSRKAARTQA